MVAKALEPLLPALEGAVAIYDEGTASHSTRVAYTSAVIARSLELPAEEIEAVSWAGILHDVGKLGVSVDVLRKTGPLSEEEWEEIRRHPSIGSDLVLAISPQLAPIAAGIRSHHERWDGMGYPDRLSGGRIPLIGRIIAVTDIFDALTHERPNRPGIFTVDQALHEISRGAGTTFDPLVSAIFVDLFGAGEIPVA